MAPNDTVLVTGATGQQGGAVVDHLLRNGVRVRALTRDADSAKSRALAARGVELAEGDAARPETLAPAFAGATVAYVMTVPSQATPADETRQGIALVDAALEAGVEHIVHSSVADADRDTRIPHFDTKRAIERHLADTGAPHTVVAPVFFMENLVSPWTLPALREGRLEQNMPGHVPLQLVSVRDVGAFTAHVIRHRADFVGERVNVAGDERTFADVAAVLSKATGRPVRFTELPLDRAPSADMRRMYEWFVETGYTADVQGLRKRHPDVPWTGFDAWASGVDWDALLGATPTH